MSATLMGPYGAVVQFMGGNMKSRGRLYSRAMRVGAVGAFVAMTGVVPLAQRAAASTYTGLSSGYDASYPQGSSNPPSGMSFAIIGLGHGRPFTTNQYAGTQWKGATKATGTTPSAYFNTGYALAYAKSDTSNCKIASLNYPAGGASGHALSALQGAWAIGCSEADWAVSTAPGTPAMWWADIETGNSWSTDTALNRATITGMFFELTTTQNTVPVGIYSTPSMWASITGSNFVVPYSVAGDWQAGLKNCSSTSPGFTSSSSTSVLTPLLLAQYGTIVVTGTTTTTTYDLDMAC